MTNIIHYIHTNTPPHCIILPWPYKQKRWGGEKRIRRRLYDQIVKEENTHLTQREKQKAAKKVNKEKTKKTKRGSCHFFK